MYKNTAFGYKIEFYFYNNYSVVHVFHTAIDIVVHFYGGMKFFEHEQNCELSCPDHSGYHYVNLHFNFNLIYSSCTPNNFSSNVHFDHIFGQFGRTDSGG